MVAEVERASSSRLPPIGSGPWRVVVSTPRSKGRVVLPNPDLWIGYLDPPDISRQDLAGISNLSRSRVAPRSGQRSLQTPKRTILSVEQQGADDRQLRIFGD